MQAPYPFKNDNKAHFLKDLTPEQFTDDQYFIAFNTGLKEQKRRAIR